MHVQGLQRTFKSCQQYYYFCMLHLFTCGFFLLHLVPTNIIGISGKTTVLHGENLQLTCEASGQPEPNITWTKEKPGKQRNTGVIQGRQVLTITNINRTDAGIFTCTAYNGFGKPEKQTVYVNVTCEYALEKHPLSVPKIRNTSKKFNL